jgi:Rod binding domain-containing protein
MATLSIPSSPLRSPDAEGLKERLQLNQRMQQMQGLPATINPQKLRETAQDFEATFLSQMMSHMFAGIETDPLTGGGEAEDIYRSMMVDEYGKLIARAGGIGIADHVVRQYLAQNEIRE